VGLVSFPSCKGKISAKKGIQQTVLQQENIVFFTRITLFWISLFLYRLLFTVNFWSKRHDIMFDEKQIAINKQS